MLSHARTDVEMIRELANDEAAYRSLTVSWFKHSPLFALIKELKEQDVKLLLLLIMEQCEFKILLKWLATKIHRQICDIKSDET